MKINLIEYFESTVNLFPEKIALVDSNSELGFKELGLRAKHVAAHISLKSEIINRPIAVYLPKSNEAIVSFLATLYSGNCYAPLDTKNPISRIESILRVLDPICIITDNAHIENIKKCGLDIDIINLNDLDFAKTDTTTAFNYKKCIDVDPAYIIHTS